mmetsp:Transcript_9673/g.17509  ORF Transcript_9673/g.17509 Transcript_9673/m.17509 type:complete len:283 (+) Transcript_9673:326-1174(+)
MFIMVSPTATPLARPQTLRDQRRNKQKYTTHVLHRTLIGEQREREKDRRSLPRRGSDRHGQRTEGLGNGRRTARAQKSRDGEEDHGGDLAGDGPRGRQALLHFAHGSGLGEVVEAVAQVSLCGGGDAYEEGCDAVESEDEFVLSYFVLVHERLAKVADRSIAQQRYDQHDDPHRLEYRRGMRIGVHEHDEAGHHEAHDGVVRGAVSFLQTNHAENHGEHHPSTLHQSLGRIIHVLHRQIGHAQVDRPQRRQTNVQFQRHRLPFRRRSDGYLGTQSSPAFRSA